MGDDKSARQAVGLAFRATPGCSMGGTIDYRRNKARNTGTTHGATLQNLITHGATQQTRHAATLSKEEKNSDKKYFQLWRFGLRLWGFLSKRKTFPESAFGRSSSPGLVRKRVLAALSAAGG